MYERHFGLTGLPFGAAPDPDFYFDSRSHRRALGYLEYATLDGESLVVMTGEVGAGKTLLVRKLLAGLDPRSFLVLQLAGARLDARELPLAVLRAFGGAAPAPEALPDGPLAELDARLAPLAAAGRRALLVVDEAQDLTPEAVAWLAGLARRPYAGGPPLQLLLVGQPELRAMLADAPAGPGLPVLLHCHVGPLAAGETRAYVEHRLRRVGWRGTPAFAADAHERIHDATGGVPRRINRLCDRLLLAACAQDTRAISAELVEQMDAELRSELGEAPVATVPAAQAARMRFAPPRPAWPGEAVAAAGRAAAPDTDLSLVIPTLVSAVEDEAAAATPAAAPRGTPSVATARGTPPVAATQGTPSAPAARDTPPPAAAREQPTARAVPAMADSEPPAADEEEDEAPAAHAAADAPVPTVRIAAVAVAAGLAVVSLIGWWFYEANHETPPVAAAVAGRAPVAAAREGAASGAAPVAATADLITQPPAAGTPASAATAAASEPPAAEPAREAPAAEAARTAEGATPPAAGTPATRAAETVSVRPRPRPRGGEAARARPAPAAEEAARAAPSPPEPAPPAAPCTPAVAALGLCPSSRPSD